jgi:hypothetical protein
MSAKTRRAYVSADFTLRTTITSPTAFDWYIRIPYIGGPFVRETTVPIMHWNNDFNGKYYGAVCPNLSGPPGDRDYRGPAYQGTSLLPSHPVSVPSTPGPLATAALGTHSHTLA